MGKISGVDRAKLLSLGFNANQGAMINELRRLIIALCAMEKCGKTTFGLSAPKPIVYFNFDRKLERSALDFIGVSPEHLIVNEIRIDGDQTQDVHRKQWNQFKEGFMWALTAADSIKSIVVDTESEMWELARLAYFGKLSQVMPHQYTEINAMYKHLLDQCDKNNKNVVFIRKMKKQYKNDKWDGRYEVAGFGKLKDIAQVNAEMYMDEEGQFTFEILNNGLMAAMNHATFSGEMCQFKYVAATLTSTGMEEWE